MKIVVGSDDAGFLLKEVVKNHLMDKGYDTVDYGCFNQEPIDYPDVAYKVAKAIQKKYFERGILICGTGIGMAISADKVKGVKAALCHDTYSAERARKSNAAQVLTMGGRVIGPELAKSIVDAWLDSEFQGGNSLRKVTKIEEYEEIETKEGNDEDEKTHQQSGYGC